MPARSTSRRRLGRVTVVGISPVAATAASAWAARRSPSGTGSFFDGVIHGGSGGGLLITAGATQVLSGTNTYTGATTIDANSTLSLSNAGSIAASSGVNLAGAFATFDISLGAGDKTIQALSGVAGSSVLLGNNNLTVGSATSTTFAGVIDGSGGTGGLVKVGTGTLTLSGANTYTGGTTINGGTLSISADNNLGDAAGGLTFGGGTLQITGANVNSVRAVTLGAGGGTFDIGQNANLPAAPSAARAGSPRPAPARWRWAAATIYAGGTTINAGLLELLPGASLGPGALAINGGSFNNGGNNVSVGGLSGTGGGLVLNGGSLTANSVANNTFGGAISGTGALIKQGTGTLTLSGNNIYSGGTTVSGGILAGTTSSLQGNILNNATVSFNQASSGTYAGAMSGTGGMTLQGGGVLGITGNNTYTGPTTVTGSGLVVNGSLASTVTLDANSAIGGTGSIGGLVSNGAMLAPGNSIGTLTVTGNFAQNGGTYVVEANPQGQSDRVNVGGTATINGATVQLVAASGSYGNSTTYTILNATGGVTGTYTGVSSNFAFLTPSLSYNANNVFLTLALQGNAFSGFGGNTVNQRNVGYALDQSFANATGDFATVIGALAGLNTQQGPYALNQISGQPYADFGTFNVANNALFMNALGQQMALARGGRGSGQRQALAEACDVAACDGAEPVQRLGQRFGRRRFGAGRRQQLDLHLQCRRRRGRHRLSPEPELPGRPRRGLHQRHAVGRQLPGQGLVQHGQRLGLCLVHPVGPLRRCPGGLRLFQQPAAAADLRPRPAAAHGQRLDRRQPVPGPGRGRLRLRHLCSRRGHRHAVRALPDVEHQPGGVQRVGRQQPQPERGSSRRRRRCARCSAPSSPVPSGWATRARSISGCGWAGCTNTPTRRGRSRRRSPARPRPTSPCTAPRRSATRR